MNARHRRTGLIDIHRPGGLFECYPIVSDLNTCRCGMIRL